ncbi:radical SAM protein [Desulfitobacterium sp. PCE1]|uniref:radical SAM protein n=1 Tax=Desulfitobacterium sp. PCE1 TaxID=146907 RepID=UPI0003686B8C|nr:radical SAM protein [Desulfitobacterium sp. PCE1]
MIDTVRMIITRKCNLSCPYCHADAYNKLDLSKELSAKDWIDGLNKLPDLKKLIITGGEPLMSDVIDKTIELVEYFTAKNVKVKINTNGTHMCIFDNVNPDDLEFQVSIDGLPLQHDKNRGKGNYKKSVNFIETQMSRGNKVKLKHVISSDNLYNINYVVSLAKKLMVQAQFQVTVPIGRGKSYDSVENKDIINIIKSNGYDYRPRITTCYRHLGVGGITASLDEYGNFIACPQLRDFPTGLNITGDFTEQEIRLRLKDIVGDMTCDTYTL